MNLELKGKINKAISKILDDNAEEGFWDFLVHDKLTEQMTEAASLVFDSSMDAQKYNDKILNIK